MVLLAPSGDESKVCVAGPQDARPVRELPAGRILDLLEASRNIAAREAATFRAREFGGLEEAVVPGLRVKDLLTPHFLRERLRWAINAQRLSKTVEGVPPVGGMAWRSLVQGMGYQIEQLPHRGDLLRHADAPVAVVHPQRDALQISRLTDNGELPEGMVLADCGKQGAHWGILAAEGRNRLFQRRPPVGPATGQHVEVDTRELEREDRSYLGLFAPESLEENGWLTDWVSEAKDFGEELRKGLEERLITDALPNIARGLGEWLESQAVDLSGRQQLRQIEEAALTLVFRFMFLRHAEARGYLPIDAAPTGLIACASSRGLPDGPVLIQPESHAAMGPASDADQESKETTPTSLEPPQAITTTGVKVGTSEPLDRLDPNPQDTPGA